MKLIWEKNFKPPFPLNRSILSFLVSKNAYLSTNLLKFRFYNLSFLVSKSSHCLLICVGSDSTNIILKVSRCSQKSVINKTKVQVFDQDFEKRTFKMLRLFHFLPNALTLWMKVVLRNTRNLYIMQPDLSLVWDVTISLILQQRYFCKFINRSTQKIGRTPGPFRMRRSTHFFLEIRIFQKLGPLKIMSWGNTMDNPTKYREVSMPRSYISKNRNFRDFGL